MGREGPRVRGDRPWEVAVHGARGRPRAPAAASRVLVLLLAAPQRLLKQDFRFLQLLFCVLNTCFFLAFSSRTLQPFFLAFSRRERRPNHPSKKRRKKGNENEMKSSPYKFPSLAAAQTSKTKKPKLIGFQSGDFKDSDQRLRREAAAQDFSLLLSKCTRESV